MSTNSIKELKEMLSINKVIGYYLENDINKYWKCKYICPFHQEKTASLHASDDLEMFNCFGCKEKWDIISFVQKLKWLDFIDALEELKESFDLDIDIQNTQTRDPLYEKKKKIYEIHDIINNVFVENINKPENNKILAILTEWRKLDISIINEFQLGYSKQFEIEKVINDLLLDKKYSEIKKEDISLYNSNWNFLFSDRIIYPIRNHKWKIVSFSWWKIYPYQEPKYIHSWNNIVYNKSHILFNYDKINFLETDKIIFCEGNLDSLQLYNYWDRRSIALLGTSLSETQIGLLRWKIKKVILILDKDSAWNKATIEISKTLIANNIVPYIINLPWNEKDVDDFLKNNIELKWKISEYIDNNKLEYFEEYLINMYIKNEDNLSLDRRIFILNLIKDILGNIKDDVLFNAYNTILKKNELLFKETEEKFLSKKDDVSKQDKKYIKDNIKDIDIYKKLAFYISKQIILDNKKLEELKEVKLLNKNFIKRWEFYKKYNFIENNNIENMKEFLEENKDLLILLDMDNENNFIEEIEKFLY